jgi:hypothetical protein
VAAYSSIVDRGKQTKLLICIATFSQADNTRRTSCCVHSQFHRFVTGEATIMDFNARMSAARGSNTSKNQRGRQQQDPEEDIIVVWPDLQNTVA